MINIPNYINTETNKINIPLNNLNPSPFVAGGQTGQVCTAGQVWTGGQEEDTGGLVEVAGGLVEVAGGLEEVAGGLEVDGGLEVVAGGFDEAGELDVAGFVSSTSPEEEDNTKDSPCLGK